MWTVGGSSIVQTIKNTYVNQSNFKSTLVKIDTISQVRAIPIAWRIYWGVSWGLLYCSTLLHTRYNAHVFINKHLKEKNKYKKQECIK